MGSEMCIRDRHWLDKKPESSHVKAWPCSLKTARLAAPPGSKRNPSEHLLEPSSLMSWNYLDVVIKHCHQESESIEDFLTVKYYQRLVTLATCLSNSHNMWCVAILLSILTFVPGSKRKPCER